jgi:hypothetical protein
MKIARLAPVFALIATVAMFALPVHADPIVWTLQDVTFDDGATATGNFTYDAATNKYSDWNILMSGGSSKFPGIYSSSIYRSSAHGDATDVAFSGGAIVVGSTLELQFSSPLSDMGGTIAVGGDEQFYSFVPPQFYQRFITSGSVTTAPAAVPEPSTLVLLASGVLIGGLIKRFRSR